MRPEIYVERPIDRELLAALLAGEHCSVLGPPRMGYSCLARRTLAALHAQGRLAVCGDLAGVGTSFTAGKEDVELFLTFLDSCFTDLQGLNGEDALLDAWQALPTPPAERFASLLAAVAPVVVLVESGDLLHHYGPLGTRFHAAMQAAPPGVTFCVFAGGAPTAQPLADDPLRLGRVFTPGDFTAEEAAVLLPALQGLGRPGYPPTALLADVLSWTNGDPYQTEALLFRLKYYPPPADRTYEPTRLVAAVVADSLQELHRPYFTAWRQKQPQAHVLPLLALYRRLLAGPQQLEPEERAEGESLIRLGMARWTPAGLAPRNDLTKLHYHAEYLAQAEDRIRRREEEVRCG